MSLARHLAAPGGGPLASPVEELRQGELARLAAVAQGNDPTVVVPTLERLGRVMGADQQAPQPTITVVIVLDTELVTGDRWDHYVREIRTSLDIHAAYHHETHSCGSEGRRRVVWYVEVKSGEMAELQADMSYHAGYLRPAGRLIWAPCSPIDL